MKTASPLLLPLLRSRSQGDILAAIMLDPDHERSLSELAAETGASVATVLREVTRLEEAGLVTSTRRGNTRLVHAITDSVVYQPLADLLAVTFGPVAVLRAALADIPGIERAFIYGSWADAYDAVAVEDSHVGVSAAVAAGMRVVATVSHYTADEDLTAADIVVDGLGEPDGAAIAVYKNDTKTEIKTHVALEHVAWLLGQSGAMRGAALTKVDSWK